MGIKHLNNTLRTFCKKQVWKSFIFFMQKLSKIELFGVFFAVLWLFGCSGNRITAHRMKPYTEKKIHVTLAHTVRIIFKTPPAKYLKHGGLNIIQAVFFTVIRLLGYSVGGCSGKLHHRTPHETVHRKKNSCYFRVSHLIHSI